MRKELPPGTPRTESRLGKFAISGGTAVGSGAKVRHNNSTAIGAGAETTRTNQVVIGRSTDTVTIPGLASSVCTLLMNPFIRVTV